MDPSKVLFYIGHPMRRKTPQHHFSRTVLPEEKPTGNPQNVEKPSIIFNHHANNSNKKALKSCSVNKNK